METTTFPTTGVELKFLFVASDYSRSLAFYRDVLGATVVREISDTLCLLRFGGGEIMLTVGGEPTKDKPTVTFASPTGIDRISSELVIRVPDCQAATRCCAPEVPGSSLHLSTGATKLEPSSVTRMVTC
jgi:predicted enzyme related to lactoylglutathione lyase